MSDYTEPRPQPIPPVPSVFNEYNWISTGLQGIGNGAQGPQGLAGGGTTPGPQGPQGVRGLQGFQQYGFQGYQGDVGVQGWQGLQGFIGIQGAQGRQGDFGYQGLQGPQGPQGIIGSQGRQGSQGVQGDVGGNGLQGYQGVQGDIGGQGNQGRQGFQGNQGSNGTNGLQGYQGLVGFQGFQGLSGPQGRQGFQGNQGNIGIGLQGFQGPTGNDQPDEFIRGYNLLGSEIKTTNLCIPSAFQVTSAITLTDETLHLTAVYLSTAQTVTGVIWEQATQGVYTATGVNNLALYSISGGTLTRVAYTANDGLIWKEADDTVVKTPFIATYNASAGVYYIGVHYNNSAQTTAPQLSGVISNFNLGRYDFTNSYFMTGTQGSLPTQPTTILASNVTPSNSAIYVNLY